MSKLALSACAGLLLALPAAAHAQPDAHPQSADQPQHDHSAPQQEDAAPAVAPMDRPQMEMGKHMEDCCCPCCRMMRDEHGAAQPDTSEAPAAPEQHQH